MNEGSLIQRAAIAMMESPEWGLGDLKTAQRMARLALEAVAPLPDLVRLFEEIQRRKELKDFDAIWPIPD